MPRYLVVAFLEPISVGAEFSRRRWPLHVTVSTNFDLDAPADEVVHLLTPIASGITPFTATPGPPAGFGARGTVPVALAEPAERWRRMHDAIVSAIRDAGGRMVHPHWGPEYRPHAAEHRARWRQPIRIDRVTLVALTGPTARVLADLSLG